MDASSNQDRMRDQNASKLPIRILDSPVMADNQQKKFNDSSSWSNKSRSSRDNAQSLNNNGLGNNNVGSISSGKKSNIQRKDFVLLESDASEIEEKEQLVLLVQFESMLQRDAFLITARVMRIRRNIPMGAILSNVDNLILNYWFP